MPLLIAAFIVVPLVELWVILQVGSAIGAGWTIALLFADSVLGAVLVKREGRRAWHAFRDAIAGGRWPGDEVVQGALVLVGGALLLTPGFVTDAAGFLAVLPPSRAVLSALIRHRLAPVSPRGADRTVLDVEVISIEPDHPTPPRSSGTPEEPTS